MQAAASLARFLTTPENRAAGSAVEQIIDAFRSRTAHRLPATILLHGPKGVGKTHLVSALVKELARIDPTMALQQLSANEWKSLTLPPERSARSSPTQASNEATDPDAEPVWLTQARHSDLLVVEDLQHLPARTAERFVQLLDARSRQRLATVLTANLGPRQLTGRDARFPTRLTSRLAAGLVIAIEPIAAPNRLLLLEELAQRRQLPVAPEILQWLAEHLTGGGRQLEGAIAQLDTLAKLQRQPLQLADIRPHFRVQIDALRPSVERIVRHVGGHFHVDPRDIMERRRLRAIVLPRQISMYLARQLTRLSLKQIGASFGGQDHTTVLYACRKIQREMLDDAVLSGAVRQLHAELT